ncbi:plasmid mobilization relaxosome protein MobC [Desertivirga arenae]|uniref:plasmid mobilization relaxosome protein MobC n=1 Tax=Desertivirga arenae TaxID=2810309 RepID=UPI001A979D5D|nr:plasmid mobilization relaxosome protein MobC [Pedobacter sp. SYSU D00823]
METKRIKRAQLNLRLSDEVKDRWKKIADERGLHLTDMVIASVENKLLNSDRREIMSFIEKQGNVFAKIENNINQIAKYVNTQKNISDSVLVDYNSKLRELNCLQIEQNELFRKIYKLLAK